jgi:hypothetical protein
VYRGDNGVLIAKEAEISRVGKDCPEMGLSLLKRLKCIEYKQGAIVSPLTATMNMNKKALQSLASKPVDDRLKGIQSALADDDRNLRVFALRFLRDTAADSDLNDAQFEDAVASICSGLKDTKRRVRDVALKSCQPFLSHQDVVNRLREMVHDDKEKRKLRGGAIAALSNASALGPAGAEAVSEMLEIPALRQPALLWLAQVPLTDPVKELLQAFVETGSREEAVMATRALCGYRIINLAAITDPKKRREFAQSGYPASGRAWYWMKRDE